MARPWPVPQSWRRHGFWPDLGLSPRRGLWPWLGFMHLLPRFLPFEAGASGLGFVYVPPVPDFESLPFLSHARLPKQEAMGIV